MEDSMKKSGEKEGGGMEHERNRRLTAGLAAVGLAVWIVLLTACGREAPGGSGQKGQGRENYIAEFFPLEEEGVWGRMVRLAGENLYYLSMDGEGRAWLCTYALDSGAESAVSLGWQEGRDETETREPDSFAVNEAGDFFVLAGIGEGAPRDSYELYRFDGSGKVVYSLDVTQQREGHLAVMAADARGRLYLGCGEKVWLYDEAGVCQGSISLGNAGEWAADLGCGRDGKIYAAYYRGTGVTAGQADYYLAELNFERKRVEAVYEGFRGDGNAAGLIPGAAGDFLTADDRTVYEYSLENQTETLLFHWLDCSVDGTGAELAGVLEDGRIVAVYEDSWDGTGGIAVLSKADGQAVQKEEIVFGTMTLDGRRQSEVARFNRDSSRYRVVVKEYLSDGKSWEDAAAELTRDIGVGNCPDVVNLTGLRVRQLAEKGVFADLSPYLEESAVLDREDFLENILDAYTFGDVLVSVPSHFQIRTVAGSAGLPGGAQGWTIEDVIAYGDAHPEAELFHRAAKDSVLRFLMTCSLDAFLDWQTGECCFDSDLFKYVLEFVNRFPEETMPGADALPAPSRIQAGQVLLMEDFLYGPASAQLHGGMFPEGMAYVGYPTADGDGGHVIFSVEHAYAIPDRAACRDGAWSFLETILEQADQGRRWGSFFPVRKSRLEEEAREAMQEKEEYDSVSYAGGYGVNALHWSYTYHAASREEVEQTLAVVRQARLPAEAEEEILDIIAEEIRGQKTVDETAAVIQSRVSIYVRENQ